MGYRVTLIPGDGVGSEVAAAAVKVIEATGAERGALMLAEGARLPAERDLADRFGVSRPMVSQALRMLDGQDLGDGAAAVVGHEVDPIQAERNALRMLPLDVGEPAGEISGRLALCHDYRPRSGILGGNAQEQRD